MQGYVPARDEAFAQSRKCFRELEDWMASDEAAGLQHQDSRHREVFYAGLGRDLTS
jgi:hypothetical protein